MYFGLLWGQHGGSGLSLTMADVLELDFSQLEFFSERMSVQREREARALRRK